MMSLEEEGLTEEFKQVPINSWFIIECYISWISYMDMMESESSSSVDPVDEVYEENEVVWAKIHGYPWWPAFVDGELT